MHSDETLADRTQARELCRADPTAARPARAATVRAATGSAPPDRSEFGEGYKVRGRYLLEKLIGQDAMREVWRARDLLGEEAQDHDAHVALKVLNTDFATPELKAIKAPGHELGDFFFVPRDLGT